MAKQTNDKLSLFLIIINSVFEQHLIIMKKLEAREELNFIQFQLNIIKMKERLYDYIKQLYNAKVTIIVPTKDRDNNINISFDTESISNHDFFKLIIVKISPLWDNFIVSEISKINGLEKKIYEYNTFKK